MRSHQIYYSSDRRVQSNLIAGGICPRATSLGGDWVSRDVEHNGAKINNSRRHHTCNIIKPLLKQFESIWRPRGRPSHLFIHINTP